MRKLALVDIGTLLVAAGVLIWQILVPPVLGLANNGDFHKVLGGFSLGAPTEDEYKFAPTLYKFDPRYHVDVSFYSTEQLLVVAALGLNYPFSSKGYFDLRFIGVIHALFYLLALALLLPLLTGFSLLPRLALSATLIFVFCDVMYASTLNSFYMDVPAFLFLALSAVFVARILFWKRRRDVVGLVVCGLLCIGSKTQHAPIGILMALMVGIQPARFLPGTGKLVRAAVIAALVGAVILSAHATPWDYQGNPLFSTVFYGILPRSKAPLDDLRRLGLPQSDQQYIGHYAYVEPSPLHDPEFTHRFLNAVSLPKLGWFFLQNPRIAFEMLRVGMNDSGAQRPDMGNYDRSAGRPDSARSYGFAAWSSLKIRLFRERGLAYLLYTVLLGAGLNGALLLWRRDLPDGIPLAGWTLTAAMIMEMLIANLGDALDFVRHAFLFTAVSDMVLVALVMAIGWRVRLFQHLG